MESDKEHCVLFVIKKKSTVDAHLQCAQNYL